FAIHSARNTLGPLILLKKDTSPDAAKPTLAFGRKLLVRRPVPGQLRRDLCGAHVRCGRREFKTQKPFALHAVPVHFWSGEFPTLWRVDGLFGEILAGRRRLGFR